MRHNKQVKLSQQEKVDLFFDRQYRRFNENYNDPKTFNFANPQVQPTGKPDSNFKYTLTLWHIPLVIPDNYEKNVKNAARKKQNRNNNNGSN